jgi:5'-nucleotidase
LFVPFNPLGMVAMRKRANWIVGCVLVVAIPLLLAACNSDNNPGDPVTVRIIGMNDFHGNIEVPAANNGGTVVVADPANPAGTGLRTGGAAFVATLLKQLRAQQPNTVLVGAGDLIGASPATSALTHDEATVDILNQLGLEATSVGNHEFDRGKTELKRIQGGGCFPGGVIGQDTCLINGAFPGAKYTYLSANVVDATTGQPLFPAAYVKSFGDIRIGFIGLTLRDTPSVVTAAGVAGLNFLDEASTINTYAAQLRTQGVNAVVVLIHQGGQTTATTANDKTCPNLSGQILPIVDALSKDVDVVISGHTHQEYVCNRNGKLLTQTGFYGSALTVIDLTIQPRGGVLNAVANTVPVVNDQNKASPAAYPVLAKDADVDASVQRYVGLSAGLRNSPAGTITADIKRALLPNSSTPTRDETAEGAMGDVMADVYLDGGPRADLAFINPGGVRADLIYKTGGTVTFGDLLGVAPFGNTLVTVDLTGAQILRLLEQQWEAPNCAAKQGVNGCGRLLQPSSTFTYTWNGATVAGAPDGQGNRVVAGSMAIKGAPVDLTKTYRVTFNSFNAPGPGDNFSVVTKGTNITPSGVIDIDAFVSYMKNHPGLAPPAPRVKRVN